MTYPEKAGTATAESVSRYVVSCSSYLRRKGSVALDLLTKLDVIWRTGERITPA